MGIRGALTDREYDKFDTTSAGLTAVRTLDQDVVDELKVLNSLVPEEYDYIDLSYDTGSNLTGSVFKLGGSGGSVISTLQLAYDTAGNMVSVAKV